MIRDIEHLAIHSKDPASLVNWYCETLGFTITHAIEDNGQYFISLPGGGMIEFLPANDSQTVSHARNDAGIRHIAFTAENYDDVVAELESKGVTFANDSHDAGEGNKRNFFDDPDGNVLQLIHRPEPLG
jgi:glyoxylase I family protein